MGKRRSRGGHTARFIALPHYMLKSEAWRTMSPNAKAVLLHLWERHNGSNNGEISYAVREAEEIGLKRSAAAAALDELVTRGFLACTRQSAFTVKTRAARLWRITAEQYGSERATKEFMTWTAKSKTQSAQTDAQSAQTDREAKNERRLPPTVRPYGLSAPKSVLAQSAQTDTSIIPGVGASSDASRGPLPLPGSGQTPS